MSNPKRPRDTNQLAKAIVDLATGEAEEENPDDSIEESASVVLARKGGSVGGKARAEKLTPEERSEIARIAATTRWKKSD